MPHCPVAVRVGYQLRAPLRLELDSLVGALCHVCEHSIGVVVHLLRWECECSCQYADRERLARSSAGWCVD
eukprot:5513496-Pleurochrysis_carterae.AAC.1